MASNNPRPGSKNLGNIMTIFQIPNPPLIVAGIGFVIEKFTEGNVQKAGKTLFISTLIIWSYQELTTGVNIFRKILGGMVLTMTLINLFKNLY